MALLYNLGCKLNQYEGFCLKKKYAGRDGVIIVNTCCVTREAETKSRRRFAALRKKFPDKRIVVTGCTCRLNPPLFRGADEIIDNIERNDLIRDIRPEPDRARYFLKIQDGCNGQCSYCVVARLRDRIESKPVRAVRDEIGWATARGHREIVLVGANIGLYGIEAGSSLPRLLESLSTMRDLPRIRLSSIEPGYITAELVAALKNIPFCRHFHIPVQSGDDGVLKSMNRGYNSRAIAERLDLITGSFPGVGVGADIIVGFPTEGSAEFQSTYRLIGENAFMHLHVFPYSPRPITPAFGMGDPVSRREKQIRQRRLKDLIAGKNLAFRKAMMGKTYRATVEVKKNLVYGLTDNYVRVRLDRGKAKKLVAVRIDRVTETGTEGTVVDDA